VTRVRECHGQDELVVVSEGPPWANGEELAHIFHDAAYYLAEHNDAILLALDISYTDEQTCLTLVIS